MPDARVKEYARLLVEDCVGVQAGWQVLILAQALARPLLDEVVGEIARRGAYPLTRVAFGGFAGDEWLKEAPEELLRTASPIEAATRSQADCMIVIRAPENTREGADIPAGRRALYQSAMRPSMRAFSSDEKPWVGCQYPTQALAQDAGMTLAEFEEFLYGAVLVDWPALHARLQRIADRLAAGSELRIVGADTDLRMCLDGRRIDVDAGAGNMPGGEIYTSPIEDSVEGIISFSEYPASLAGHEVGGVRLRFEGGRIVEATAETDEAFLLATLDADEGARRLGEVGIGCNPGIQRHTRNTLFDEKIEGTVHVAIGFGFPQLGGANESAIHWDMVKDLRNGGRLELDGEVIQANGGWVGFDG